MYSKSKYIETLDTAIKDEIQQVNELVIADANCSKEELNDFLLEYKPTCRALKIKHDHLEELPEAMGLLSTVREVTLDLPKLKKFPDFFQKAFYTELTISCTKMPEVPEAWLQSGEPLSFPLISLRLDIDEMQELPACFCVPSLRQVTIYSYYLHQLPEDFAVMPELRRLVIEAPLRQMPLLHDLSNLKNLSLHKVEIEDFSSANCWPENLISLFIHNMIGVNKGPDFSTMQNLTKIIWRNQKPSKVNLMGISVCKNLEELEVKNVDLHEDLTACDRLRFLKIKGEQLEELPVYLMGMDSIRLLDIKDTQLSRVPEDWSGLKHLVTLSVENNQLKDFSFLYTLKSSKIDRIIIGDNPISDPLFMLEGTKKLPIETDELQKFAPLSYQETVSFVFGLSKSKFSREEKEWFYHQFQQVPKLTLPHDWSTYRLLRALNIAYKPLQDIITQRILELSGQQEAEAKLRAGAKVYLEGKFQQPKKEIKAKLETLNLTLCDKWEEGISHIVVGKRPAMKLPEASYDQVCLLLENQLYRLFEEADPKFLVQEAQEGARQMGEGVEQMLQSEEPGTQMVALEMLKNGGVPEPLFIELLLIQKCSKEVALRKAARKLLEAFGPTEWLSFVRDRKTFVNIREKEERDLYLKQCDLEEVAGKELLAQFSLKLFQRFGKGVHYLLTDLPLHDEWRLKTLELLTKDGVLDLDQWSKWKIDTYPKFPIDYPHKSKITQLKLSCCGLKYLPRELTEFDNLTELSLKENQLHEFPEVVLSMQKLKALDLGSNKIKSVPQEIAVLENLERLGLYANELTGFPKEILALKNLKELNLYTCKFNKKQLAGSLLEEIREALPSCEIKM
ncbi:hypothetical protein AAG747_11685 [Rapidithrix thailandica]|uniref:Uncharacterized protein n=1 Tax=Rapidithrix thailandica TaxID=413964 RepID=A0AAW9SCG0_9BACT